MGMLRVGIVGWRGMVGSVLVQRMREERDFDHIEPQFFSTSQAGGKGPAIGKGAEPGLADTHHRYGSHITSLQNSDPSEPVWRRHSQLAGSVARVQRSGRLEQQDPNLVVRDRPMLHASRDDEELALFERDGMVAKFHPEPAPNHQEQLIFVVMVMPDEGALKLDQFHLLTVQITDDLWRPVFGEQRELLS